MENFIVNEIDNYLNNSESEEFCKLTEKDIEDIIKNTKDNIMLDNELNKCITNTIEWYVMHYLYNKNKGVIKDDKY